MADEIKVCTSKKQTRKASGAGGYCKAFSGRSRLVTYPKSTVQLIMLTDGEKRLQDVIARKATQSSLRSLLILKTLKVFGMDSKNHYYQKEDPEMRFKNLNVVLVCCFLKKVRRPSKISGMVLPQSKTLLGPYERLFKLDSLDGLANDWRKLRQSPQ